MTKQEMKDEAFKTLETMFELEQNASKRNIELVKIYSNKLDIALTCLKKFVDKYLNTIKDLFTKEELQFLINIRDDK